MSKKKERALDLAIHYGRLEAVQLLLRSVGESTTVRAGDNSPLHLAAKHGHRNVVEALLDAGFDINHRVNELIWRMVGVQWFSGYVVYLSIR